MTELIVLGTIPGTTIQINFSFWLMSIGMMANCYVLYVVYRHRSGINRWMAGYVMAAAFRRSIKQPRQTA